MPAREPHHVGVPTEMDNGQQRLWASVILRALRDALKDRPGMRLHNGSTLRYREAREWIELPNEDFPMVCSLAGVSHVQVRRALADGSAKKELRDDCIVR